MVQIQALRAVITTHAVLKANRKHCVQTHISQVKAELKKDLSDKQRELFELHLRIMKGESTPAFTQAVKLAAKHANHPHAQGWIARLLGSKYNPNAFRLFVREYLGIYISERVAEKCSEWDLTHLESRLQNVYINSMVNYV